MATSDDERARRDGAPGDDVSRADEAARREPMDALVRRWLHTRKNAVLCTLSTRAGLEGYPFGSTAPYALDERGHPIILVAGIAAHTANLMHDARASLFVYDDEASDDPQASWRLCLMGRFVRLFSDDERDAERVRGRADTRHVTTAARHALVARYRERVRDADTYLATHDFHFFALDEVSTVRTIAGFGKITWLDGAVIDRAPSSSFEAAAHEAVLHMNEDHRENLREIVHGLRGAHPTTAVLTHLDRGGLLIDTDLDDETGGGRVFASFTVPLDDERDIRAAVIDVLRRAREAVR